MIPLIVHCFVVFGAAWGIGHAELSYPVRLFIAGGEEPKTPLRGLIVSGLQCVGCLSFWLGLALYGLGLTPPSVFQFWWQAALFSSASSLVLARLTGLTDLPPHGAEPGREGEGPRSDGDEPPDSL